MGNSMVILKNFKLELPYQPASSLLGVHSEEMKPLCQRHISSPCSRQCHPHWPGHGIDLSISGWTDKENVMIVLNGVTFSAHISLFLLVICIMKRKCPIFSDYFLSENLAHFAFTTDEISSCMKLIWYWNASQISL